MKTFYFIAFLHYPKRAAIRSCNSVSGSFQPEELMKSPWIPGLRGVSPGMTGFFYPNNHISNDVTFIAEEHDSLFISLLELISPQLLAKSLIQLYNKRPSR